MLTKIPVRTASTILETVEVSRLSWTLENQSSSSPPSAPPSEVGMNLLAPALGPSTQHSRTRWLAALVISLYPLYFTYHSYLLSFSHCDESIIL